MSPVPHPSDLNTAAPTLLLLGLNRCGGGGAGVEPHRVLPSKSKPLPSRTETIQLVCNISSRAGKGTQVYTTAPPTEVGYTIRCGCPEGFDEDADCLCFENRRSDSSQNGCTDGNCKPAVVLLPIFTVEDAPPNKLIPHGITNNTLRIGQSEVFNQNGNHMMNSRILQPQSLNEFSKLLREPDVTRQAYTSKHTSIQNRISKNSKRIDSLRQYTKSNLYSSNHNPFPLQKHEAKETTFSRVSKFSRVPSRKMFNSPRITRKEIKKDVEPRRDFSDVQKVLKTYLNKKRSRLGNVPKGNKYEYTPIEPLKPNNKFEHTKKSISKNKVTSPNRYSKQMLHYDDLNTTKDFNINYSNEEADKKIMTLLDNLEKEVKHIELDPADKEIFDAKIRKIYGTVVGKPHNLQPKPTHLIAENNIRNTEINDYLINYENAVDNEFIEKRRFKESEVYSNKLSERDQKSITNKDKSYRNTIHSIYNNEDNFMEGLTYRNGNRNRELRQDRNSYKYIDNEDNRNNNFDLKNDMNEDHLSFERRKYYQDKLDNLTRKIQSVRNNQRRNMNPPRQVRPVLQTSLNKMHIRPSKTKETDTFYIPDRARFIHGF